MRRPALLLAALICGLSAEARAVTLDEILARHVAARGGLDKLHALRSLRVTGKTTLFRGGDSQAEWARVIRRPGLVREETTLQGLTSITAFDGREGWAVEPFGGRREPTRRSADENREQAQLADLDGVLIEPAAKGHRVEYLGTEDYEGTQAHKLRVTLKDGDVELVYLDPDAFLVIHVEHFGKRRGTERIVMTDYGDYGEVAGVMIPFAIEISGRNERRRRTIHVERAEANVDAGDALFAYPGTARAGRELVVAPGAPAPAAAPAREAAAATPVFDSGVVSGLGARNIGSATMSGRVSAIDARTADGMTTIFVGSASGGVWRSLDDGTTFKPVFDRQPVQSIGAVTIDPGDPRTIWVGTGESWARNSVSAGDGIYKSTDGGETWKNMGLPESERVSRIAVNPKNGKVVYACVPGKLWSDSADRGLYKTSDGGETWSLVLKGGNLSTGCSGLALDPKNPDHVFAGLWDFRRKGWSFRSGGENAGAPSGSGMYTSSDGGKSWTQLAPGTKGLPAAPWGRIEIAVAPSDAAVVYALIEGVDSALYRSGDGGATWEARDKSQNMVWRPFYFARLVVDPTRPDRLFKPGGSLIVSEDGGRTFGPGGRGHGDWHDIWIDPTNPRHVIGGDDGGLWISRDGGTRWWKSQNLPIAQFYHVSLDDKDPYQVYGGLQDNSDWVGDSAYPGGITNSRWENLYGGDGFVTIVDPTDPGAVYTEAQGGTAGRVDRKTLAVRPIQPMPGFKEKLRWNWNTPIFASPTQKGTIYLGAQFLFRSRDRGMTWARVSPDLSSNDPEKQKQEESGGITVDNSEAEMHTSIVAIAESPRDARTIWVGTDDGNVQLSRDGGKSWKNVGGNVTGLPAASWVSFIEPSRFAPGTAYAAFDRHTFGDFTTWVYKTTDFGQTWSRLAGPGQGVRGWAHVIREDLVKPALLFLGTEFGLWISVDGGATWAEFKGKDFPSVAVREVQVHPRDGNLVIATHGRGIWIIDDLTPLRALAPEVLAKPVAFLPGRPQQQRLVVDGGWGEGDASYSGENPADGAVITYYQRSRHVFGPMKIEILDGAGKVIDTVTPKQRRGVNRVTWSMHTEPPRVPRAAQVLFEASEGPRVVPGTYKVRLTRGADVVETALPIVLDRRAPFTLADRKANLDAAMAAHALFADMSALVDRIEAAREKAKAAGQTERVAKLEAARREIVATKEGGAITGEERIREHLGTVYGSLTGWEGRPAAYHVARVAALRRELEAVRAEVDAILGGSEAPR